MSGNRFYVLARVVSREGARPFWEKRLKALCAGSAAERYCDSYYWGFDLDGEPDTIWGLEGYTHAIGFFIDHVSSDNFKEQMLLVDKDELLRTKQGLGSPDYDLKHYEKESGFLKRYDDPDNDSKTSHVAAFHFFAVDAFKRPELLARLTAYTVAAKLEGGPIQSCLVLRELKDNTIATLWIRTKTRADFDKLHTSGSVGKILAETKPLYTKLELHQSESFVGPLGIKE